MAKAPTHHPSLPREKREEWSSELLSLLLWHKESSQEQAGKHIRHAPPPPQLPRPTTGPRDTHTDTHT